MCGGALVCYRTHCLSRFDDLRNLDFSKVKDLTFEDKCFLHSKGVSGIPWTFAERFKECPPRVINPFLEASVRRRGKNDRRHITCY